MQLAAMQDANQQNAMRNPQNTVRPLALQPAMSASRWLVSMLSNWRPTTPMNSAGGATNFNQSQGTNKDSQTESTSKV